ncbi:MAG: hypothetical protein AMXMBFR84_45340 [Candidatus Hydrogenedentota bacterium]
MVEYGVGEPEVLDAVTQGKELRPESRDGFLLSAESQDAVFQPINGLAFELDKLGDDFVAVESGDQAPDAE